MSELTSVSSYALLVLVACRRYLLMAKELARGVAGFQRALRGSFAARLVLGDDPLWSEPREARRSLRLSRGVDWRGSEVNWIATDARLSRTRELCWRCSARSLAWIDIDPGWALRKRPRRWWGWPMLTQATIRRRRGEEGQGEREEREKEKERREKNISRCVQVFKTQFYIILDFSEQNFVFAHFDRIFDF